MLFRVWTGANRDETSFHERIWGVGQAVRVVDTCLLVREFGLSKARTASLIVYTTKTRGAPATGVHEDR